MKRSTISDVAKHTGVSVSTVSNYLNSRYENMSSETRQKIEAAVAALNYTPNISARRLSAKKKCGVICLVFPIDMVRFFGSFYYPIVLRAVGRASSEVDRSVLIYILGEKEPAKEIEYLKGMYGTIADGFLLFNLTVADDYFRQFESARIPYMCVGKIHGKEDYNFVATDHAAVVEDAVEYLVSLGHRRIALLKEDSDTVAPVSRQRGYEKAMGRIGWPLDPRYIANHPVYQDGSEDDTVLLELLTQEDPPTALILSATQIRKMENICTEHGIRIPEDLSVIVLEFSEEYQLHGKNYTHYRNIADEVAREAFLSLLRLVDEPEKKPRSLTLPVKMSGGDSTAPRP